MNNQARIKAGFAKVFIYCLIAIAFLFSFLPIGFAIVIALMKEQSIPLMFESWNVFINGFSFDNFIKVMSESQIPRWILNSLIVAGSQTVLYLFIASLAAFAFARLKFKGRKIIFNLLLASMMIPGIINIVPNFIIISELGLYDNILAMILPGLSGVFGVFFLRQFMRGIPRDFDESARIDGANNFQIYFRIILPMCKPALASLAIFTFQGAWNDFLWPIIVTSTDSSRTLAAGLYITLMNDAQFKGSLMAASLISALPIVIIFIFGQKYFTEGLSGGLKN